MGEEETQQLGDAQQEQEITEAAKPLSQMNKDELKAKAEELEQQLNEAYEQLDQERKEKDEIIDDLSRRNESLERAVSTPGANGQRRVVIELNGGSYEVLAPKFRYKGEDHTADELQENSELLKELLDKGVGFLRRL